jgi:hypothetical protein
MMVVEKGKFLSVDAEHSHIINHQNMEAAPLNLSPN